MTIEQLVRHLRPDVRRVQSRSIREGAPAAPRHDEAAAALVAAISAAARAGAAVPVRANAATVDLDQLKRSIDGAATDAAEAAFGAADLRIRVVAGEGVRDDSPGAFTGQTMGQGDDAWDGIFDYVDGTTLVARGLPGALALGGLGRGVRRVPDLQAYAVLCPVDSVDDVDLMSIPEEHARDVLAMVARANGTSVDQLTVLTHSLGSGQHHRTLIGMLREATKQVIVPDPVIIEPPYLLSLEGLTSPRIDTMIGAIGLSELVFAAALLDLVSPGYGFAFRMASIDGPRRHRTDRLWPLFEFTDTELTALREMGWEPDRQYTTQDLVPTGAAAAAAIFGVSGGGPLDLPAPQVLPDEITTSGLLLEAGGRITDLRVTESHHLPA